MQITRGRGGWQGHFKEEGERVEIQIAVNSKNLASLISIIFVKQLLHSNG